MNVEDALKVLSQVLAQVPVKLGEARTVQEAWDVVSAAAQEPRQEEKDSG